MPQATTAPPKRLPRSQPTDTPPDLAAVLRRTILEDLAAGDEPLTLNIARNHPALRRRGERRSIPAVHRIALSGDLETVKIIGVKHTTASAILRYIARASGIDTAKPLPADRAARGRSILAAERRLAAAGI